MAKQIKQNTFNMHKTKYFQHAKLIMERVRISRGADSSHIVADLSLK